MYKALGDEGLAARVDHNVGLIVYMATKINSLVDERGGPRFLTVAGPTFANLCFYSVPPSLALAPGTTLGDLNDAQLAALASVAPVVKNRMQRGGRGLVGFQPVRGYVNCWRMVAAGAKEHFDEAGVDTLLADMVRFSADL